MDSPDLEIAALLILAQLGFDFVITGRRRPDLDHEWERLRVDLQAPCVLLTARQRHGHDGDIRNEVALARSAQASRIMSHAKCAPIKLRSKLNREIERDIVVLEGHGWLGLQL